MPLPLIILGAGALGGVGAAKGTAAIRRRINVESTIEVKCPSCKSGGPHQFVFINRSWAGGAVVGVLAGAVGGTVSGMVARRVFRCSSCGCPMYKNGKRPGWNADDAIEMFFRYPRLKKAYQDLLTSVSRSQAVAAKYAKAIEKIERDLSSKEKNIDKLEQAIRALTAQIKRERTAK